MAGYVIRVAETGTGKAKTREPTAGEQGRTESMYSLCVDLKEWKKDR